MFFFEFCVASLRHIHGPFVSLQEWGNCHPVAVEDSFLPRPDLPAGYCFYGTRIDTAKWRMGPSDQPTIGLEPGSGSGLNQKILRDEVMVTEKLQSIQHSLRFKRGIPARKMNYNFSWRIILDFWHLSSRFKTCLLKLSNHIETNSSFWT